MKTKVFLIGLIIVLTAACSQKKTKQFFIDKELMIQVPGSELYVRMRGNPQGPLIINLHGGPGGYSGIDIQLTGPGLEDKFLIAYLDQRGSITLILNQT